MLSGGIAGRRMFKVENIGERLAQGFDLLTSSGSVGGGRGGLLGGEFHGHLVPLLLVSPKTGTNKQNKK